MLSHLSFLVFQSLVLLSDASYNPIPFASVIISTTRTISVMQPDGVAANKEPTVIFSVPNHSIIVDTMCDPSSRDLYVLFSNTTNGTVYVSRLVAPGKLDPIVYQLPIVFNATHRDPFTSLTSDLDNRRAFLTDSTGRVTMFSLSGAMSVDIAIPSTTRRPIRSVLYHRTFNRLFMVSDSIVSSCTGLDRNELQCCQVRTKTNQLRSITIDTTSKHLYVYVTDAQTGIHQIALDDLGCPTESIQNVGSFYSVRLAIYQDRYFSSGNNDDSNNNSVLIIGNVTKNATRDFRTLTVGTSIVALHFSHPRAQSNSGEDETCFRGITYYDYRVAVVLAALFGTIMGIFMCVNALCCVDFFMTKRIIRDLRKQIPHDFLEDRWNKLVDEKYAKLALESQLFTWIDSVSQSGFL